jgi:DNA-binding beta-propeller fold protein YncE
MTGKPIPIGGTLASIAISPDGKTAYVMNFTGSITAISTATRTVKGKPIRVAGDPRAITIAPDGGTAYLLGFGASNVTVISLATGTVKGKPIPVGAGPYAIAITPDQAPVAALSVTPAAARRHTRFNASASRAPSSPVVSYAWHFGDGSSAVTATPAEVHTYARPGSYTAWVTETDAAGTSTARVFTGQTMSRNGGPQATARRTFRVRAG